MKDLSHITYDVKSTRAEEFIHDGEIRSTLEYAREHSCDKELIDKILAKAELGKGLSHREAAVLIEVRDQEAEERMYTIARQLKERIYGNRIVMFAPLYLSNHCVNGCVYCPYHAQNRHIPRRRLTQEEIRREVIALQDMGHKRLALETGEHPKMSPIEYVLESIKTIYSIRHKNGAIRRVNVNIAATTVENYRLLKEAGIGTYILFEETYDRATYERLHPTGPKSDWAYHTEAMDRAMLGGIDDVGIGALFGLSNYRYDATEHLVGHCIGEVFGIDVVGRTYAGHADGVWTHSETRFQVLGVHEQTDHIVAVVGKSKQGSYTHIVDAAQHGTVHRLGMVCPVALGACGV